MCQEEELPPIACEEILAFAVDRCADTMEALPRTGDSVAAMNFEHDLARRLALTVDGSPFVIELFPWSDFPRLAAEEGRAAGLQDHDIDVLTQAMEDLVKHDAAFQRHRRRIFDEQGLGADVHGTGEAGAFPV